MEPPAKVTLPPTKPTTKAKPTSTMMSLKKPQTMPPWTGMPWTFMPGEPTGEGGISVRAIQTTVVMLMAHLAKIVINAVNWLMIFTGN